MTNKEEQNTMDTSDSVISQGRELVMKNAKTTGIIMIIIGVLGILLPNVIGLSFNMFIGGMFLAAALALTYNAWQDKQQSFSLWFKPFLLAVFAFVILLHPIAVLSVLGLLLALYFMFSGFSSFMMAFEFEGSARWMSLLNGILSFVLGVVVFDSWPFASAWIIGFIIGINFFFEGIALVSISNNMKEDID